MLYLRKNHKRRDRFAEGEAGDVIEKTKGIKRRKDEPDSGETS